MMGDRTELVDQIYFGDYIPDFYLERDIQSETSDDLTLGSGHDLQLDSRFRPLFLRMTSITRDSLMFSGSNISSNVVDIAHVPLPTQEKFKASNFPIMSLKIGTWEKYSRHEGELVAKYYYAKKKIVWEFMDGVLKNKIEIKFGDIDAIKATMDENQPGTLEILLSSPPQFFRETNPLPKKHTLWHESSDFTGGQARTFRKHFVRFPSGALDRHYLKLLQSDSRLSDISQNPFPNMDFPYFPSKNFDTSNNSLGYEILPQSLPAPMMSYQLPPQRFPLQYGHVNYNLPMMTHNSINMHDNTQSLNSGMHYHQRNNIVSNNMFNNTMAPLYQSENDASNMLPAMNEQMQFIPNVMTSVQEGNAQQPRAFDETNEILWNIEQHLLGDSPTGNSYEGSILENQGSHNQDNFINNTLNGDQEPFEPFNHQHPHMNYGIEDLSFENPNYNYF